jgi:mono/diheme cytochrome c family protein
MKLQLAAVLVVFATACLVAQNRNYAQDPNWKPPSASAEKRNPLAEKPELSAGGKKLFARHCVECHGQSGEGLKKAADLQLPVVQNQSDGTLFWKITNGNPDRGMPSFSGIPEQQRWQIVLHLRTLAHKDAAH